MFTLSRHPDFVSLCNPIVKQKAAITFLPYIYFKEPSIVTRDCCVCFHESETKLNIPPLIEIAGTWISPKNPINEAFIFIRFMLTLYIMYCAVFSFILFAKAGDYEYYLIYYAQWNAVLATILMITKSISSIKVYLYIQNKLQNENNTNFNQILYGEVCENIDATSSIWEWYIFHKILLQISLPSMTVAVFYYWYYIYGDFDYFPDENNKLGSIQTHGLSCIALWIDFLFSAERLYYKSFIFPVLIATLYTICTVIFESTSNVHDDDDPYLYKVSDWLQYAAMVIITLFVSLILLMICTFIATFIKNVIFMISRMRSSYQQIMQITDTDEEELVG